MKATEGNVFYVLKCLVVQDEDRKYVKRVTDYGGHGGLTTLEDAKRFGTVKHALHFMTRFEPKPCLTLVRVTEEKIVDTRLIEEEVR